MSAPMTRADVERIVREARAEGRIPNLRWADLRGADLRGADLRGADLRGADLRGADLRGADLRGANLRGANLRWADLRGADLRGADLCWANLRGANLHEADLREADLHATSGDVLVIEGLPSGRVILVPTPPGWSLSVGCWKHHTVSDLRTLIASDKGWPSARGTEIARRRPLLAAAADLCDAHIAAHPDTVPALAARWGVTA